MGDSVKRDGDDVQSATTGGYCNGCGANAVTTTMFSDGMVKVECQNCARMHGYVTQHSGPQGCKTTFTPDK